jgi:Glycosyl hydrolase family 79 C-terminal beta domain
VQRHPVRNGLLAALILAVIAVTVAALGGFDSLTAGAQPTAPTVSASVDSTPSGPPLPSGFVGVSLEYNWLHFYTGRNPNRVNPVLIALIRNLAPGGQTPVLRIGGESTDATWWPIRGQRTPAGISYALTQRWLRIVRGLATALRARVILGVNFAAGRQGLAAAEARAFLRGIGRRYIRAFEIGNEPDNYGIFPWYRTEQGRGRWVWARPSNYSLTDFIAQFSRFRTALPAGPVAGPAFAELTWLNGLGQFLSAEPTLSLTTVHRYPLHGCLTNPEQAGYPSAANLLSDQASTGLAQAVARSVAVAHEHHVPLRLDEMNSASVASCLGKRGVSGTFASALWVLDTLFNLASVGVDGVNVHTLPSAAYELFSFRHKRGGWEAAVHPEYYGMLLFVQAFPPGARLLPVTTSPSGPLKAWATRAPDGKVRVVLINKDLSTPYQVQLQVPGAQASAQLERLLARSASSRSGVKLGGRTFGSETRTGTLPGRPLTETVVPASGTYSIMVPAASAALLTL